MPKRIPVRDCTSTCKSEQHANEIISAITLPSSLIPDKLLASFVNSTCCCFDSIKDELGRTVLHISASVGRKDLCQWLVRYSNVDIDAQDFESGYTPLHRSIFYGYVNVAVTLMKLGADIYIKDHEDYCPIDLSIRNINVDLIPYLIHSKFANKEVSCIATMGKTHKKEQDLINSDVSYNGLCKVAEDKRDRLNAVCNSYFTEVYTWGTNHNYTNGIGAERGRKVPEYLEFFEKRNEVIIDICMHKCHTLFVSLSGNVWSCGLGQGGRLGLSSEETVLIPQKIVFPSNSINSPLFCTKAAIGQDHSIFICNDNQIFTCGSNTYHQLGSTTSTSASKPQLATVELWNENILGAGASTYHSVVWTSSTLYTCGLHGGQLGHPNSPDRTVPSFKKVPCLYFNHTSITNVAVSDGAIVVVTDSDDIFLLTEYKCQKINFKHIVKYVSTKETCLAGKLTTGNYLAAKSLLCLQIVLKVAVIGGTLDAKKIKPFNSSYRPEELKIAVLLWNGNVYLCKKDKPESETRLISCDFLVKHEIKVTDLVLNSNHMMIVTRTGESFVAYDEKLTKTFNKNKNTAYTTVNYHHEEIDGETYHISLKKIPNALRAVSIFSDPKGDNFAILQERSIDIMENFPTIKSTLHSDLEKFYRESCDYDTFPDITYQVDSRTFTAHKYIVSYCSEELASLKPTNGIVHVKNINPEIFKEVLTFAYTGTCDLFKVGSSFKINKGNEKPVNSPAKYEDPFKLAIKAARDYKMKKFASQLEKFKYENECICLKNKNDFVRPVPCVFNRIKYKNLCDIKLRSQDGQVFHAHKCILVARMEYFKLMLSGFWMESSNNNDELNIPVSGTILQEILEYLYTDNVAKSVVKKDMNFWCNLLVAADQFVLPNLKEICECALVQCFDVRNTVDILLFADTMGMEQLKISCYEFISINLPSFLESRSLERLNDDLLNTLTIFYRNFARTNVSSHYAKPIPTYSAVRELEEVVSIGNALPIEWEIFIESDLTNDVKKKPIQPTQKKKIKRIRKSSTTEPEKGKKSDEENKAPSIIHQNVIIEVQPPITPIIPEDNWIEVDKQLKSVKCRLKINSAVKKCPEMIEQKENFTTLGKLPTSAKQSPVVESPLNEAGDTRVTKSSPITISIDFQNLTPKLSQKQRKKLRTVSESSTSKIEESEPSASPKIAWSMKCSSPPSDSVDINASDCWGSSKSPQPMSFSAIMDSEKKQKITIKKETKKIESKSLHLAQIEDKAIQDLIAFYNANNIDEERITVKRVIFDVEAPQWVTK